MAEPQISPDGSQVAFTHLAVNSKKGGYDTSVWLVSSKVMSTGAASKQITSGPRDGSPRWSPDGERIVFTRASDKGLQLFILPMDPERHRNLRTCRKARVTVCHPFLLGLPCLLSK